MLCSPLNCHTGFCFAFETIQKMFCEGEIIIMTFRHSCFQRFRFFIAGIINIEHFHFSRIQEQNPNRKPPLVP